MAAFVMAMTTLLCPGLGMGGARAEACKLLVASGNPEYPPYLWRNPENERQLIGANAALMAMLSAEIGIPIEVRYIGSWARVQEEMKNGHIDLISGAFLTTERLAYMDYIHPTIATTRSVVITMPDSAVKYRQRSDLVGHRGVTVINNSFGEEFDQYARKNLSIDEVSKLENALRMVENRRADYLIYEDAPARAIAAQLGIDGLMEAPDSISNEDLYLTLSHRSACNSGALRGMIAEAMNRFAEEKVMDRLIADAIQLWQAQ
ncbi:MAG: transporter substrate-binding domain-containing protein [Rhodospirillaceae bacterium]|nr:transporter substrate-binding domain-containing protein [Rhodospirillaceae bacterium]